MAFLEFPQDVCICRNILTLARKKYEDSILSGISSEKAIDSLGLKRGCCLKTLFNKRYYVADEAQGGSQVKENPTASKIFTIDKNSLIPHNQPQAYENYYSSEEDIETSDDEDFQEGGDNNYYYPPSERSDSQEYTENPVVRLKGKKSTKRSEDSFEDDPELPPEIRDLEEPDQRGKIDLTPGTVISTGWARVNKAVKVTQVGMGYRSVHVSTLSL